MSNLLEELEVFHAERRFSRYEDMPAREQDNLLALHLQDTCGSGDVLDNFYDRRIVQQVEELILAHLQSHDDAQLGHALRSLVYPILRKAHGEDIQEQFDEVRLPRVRSDDAVNRSVDLQRRAQELRGL